MIEKSNRNYERKSIQYNKIDFVRIICAFLIIVIHTSPLKNISEVANFYLKDVVARIAVPLFYAISGFMFFRKLVYENGKIKKYKENHERLIRYLKKNTLLYLSWSIVYILVIQVPIWRQLSWGMLNSIKDCVASFFLVGTYYHFWYLLALIYAIPILYLLLCHLDVRKVFFISCILWCVECLTYSYSWMGLENVALVSFTSSHSPIVFDTLFRVIPLLMVGVISIQSEQGRNMKKKRIAFLVSFVACATEASVLCFFSPNESNFSYLVTTPVMTYFGMLVITDIATQYNMSKSKADLLRSMSVIIYCVHPLIIHILSKIGVPQGVEMWCMTMIVSIIFSVGAVYLLMLLKTFRKENKE